MTKTFNIPIEGLPEGWEVQKVTVDENGVKCTWKEGKRMTLKAEIKLKKSKPRRIVLEETGEDNISESGGYKTQHIGSIRIIEEPQIWHQVKGGE